MIIALNNYFISSLIGMNSLYTITGMATVRYLSVVRLDCSWHAQTSITFWSSRYIRLIWGLAFVLSLPPLLGVGTYVIDMSKLR